MTCCIHPPFVEKLPFGELSGDRFRSLVIRADGDANDRIAELGSRALTQGAGRQRAHRILEVDNQGLDRHLALACRLGHPRDAQLHLAHVVRLDGTLDFLKALRQCATSHGGGALCPEAGRHATSGRSKRCRGLGSPCVDAAGSLPNMPLGGVRVNELERGTRKEEVAWTLWRAELERPLPRSSFFVLFLSLPRPHLRPHLDLLLTSLVMRLVYTLALLLSGLAPLAAQGAPASGSFELSIRNIMRGPELVGRPPQDVRWSPDGRWIYFRWLEPGTSWREDLKPFRVRATAGAKPERLTPAQMDSAAPLVANGDLSRDQLLRAVEHDGDLYVIDMRRSRARRLTDTRDRESSPRFDATGQRVFFLRNDNAFAIDLAN